MKRILALLILACTAQAMEPSRSPLSQLPAEMCEQINLYTLANYSNWPLLNKIISKMNVSIDSLENDEFGTFTLSNNKIIYGTQNGTITILDLASRQVLPLKGHTDYIYHLSCKGDKLISGSGDSTIKVWDLKTGTLLYSLSDPTEYLHPITIQDDKLISASADNKIRIWNIENGDLLHTLVGHNQRILKLCTTKEKIVSVAEDNKIIVWDLKTGLCLQDLDNNETPWPIKVHNNKIIFGLNEIIEIRDLDTFQLLNSLDGHKDSGIIRLKISDNKLISTSTSSQATSNPHNIINVWDLNSGQCLQTINNNLRSLSTDGSKLVVLEYVDDAKTSIIKIIDLTSGEILHSTTHEYTTLTTNKTMDSAAGPVFMTVTHYQYLNHVEVSNNKIYCGRDNLMNVWSLHNGKALPPLIGKVEFTSPFTIIDNKLIYYKGDKIITLWDLDKIEALEKSLRDLPIDECAIFQIIQDEIVKNSDGSLRDDLCDEKGLNPLQKAKLYKAYELAAVLEATGLFKLSKIEDDPQPLSSNNDIS